MKQRIIGNDIIEYSNYIANVSDNEISSMINEMSSLLDEIKWEGKAKESFAQNYKNTLFEIRKIPNVLKLYSKFLSSMVVNYEDLMIDLKAIFNEIENEDGNIGDVNE